MITRQNCDPTYPGTLASDQAITLQEALPLFTRNGARSLGMDNETGTLTAGKWADFIVLEKSLFATEPLDMGLTKPQLTAWKGKIVHEG